jgi:hypothetical protein
MPVRSVGVWGLLWACAAEPVDADGDGFADDVDCDDADADISPGAVDDFFDAIDEDCDGRPAQPDYVGTYAVRRVENIAWLDGDELVLLDLRPGDETWGTFTLDETGNTSLAVVYDVNGIAGDWVVRGVASVPSETDFRLEQEGVASQTTHGFGSALDLPMFIDLRCTATDLIRCHGQMGLVNPDVLDESLRVVLEPM